MVTRERMGSPEAVVIYFASISITYHLQSIANQSLLITAILSGQATRSSGAWQDKTAAWETNSVRAQPVIWSSRKVPPRKKATGPLHDKTKNCCAELTCRHNNTKSWYCYYSLLLTIWYDESSSQRAKTKITKNNIFALCALKFIFVECYSKEIETAPKLNSPY